MEISVTSLGSSQTLRWPQLSSEAANLFCNFRLTIISKFLYWMSLRGCGVEVLDVSPKGMRCDGCGVLGRTNSVMPLSMCQGVSSVRSIGVFDRSARSIYT